MRYNTSKTSMYLSVLMVPPEMCKVPMPWVHTPISYFGLLIIQIIFFLFSRNDVRSMISKNNLKFGLIKPQHTFILSVSQSVSDELRPREVTQGSDFFFKYLAFALHGLNLHLKMQRQTVFTDKVFLSTCSNTL